MSPIVPQGGPAAIPAPSGPQTVGNMILSAREMFTDRCQVLNPPGAETGATLIGNSPRTLQWGTYFVKLAYRTGPVNYPWGETLPGVELGPFVVDATHSIQINGFINNTYGTQILPAGATAVVAYYGTQGNEYQDHRQQLADHQRRHRSQVHQASDKSARFARAHAQADQRRNNVQGLQENENS